MGVGGAGRPHTCAGSGVQVVPMKNASIFIIKEEQGVQIQQREKTCKLG